VEAVLELARSLDDPWAAGELTLLARRSGVDVPTEPAHCAEPYLLHLTGQAEAAAAAWSRLGCRYEAADALTESDDPGSVAAGLEALRGLGARPRAAVAARRLRGLGQRVPRGPNQTTRGNAAHLTDRELDVVHLLAQGRSNAEIAEELRISQKTVGHHVSHILTKLDARNRSEVAAMAARLDL
jgi:DNA-binding NarL/FixJ family response regulator